MLSDLQKKKKQQNKNKTEQNNPSQTSPFIMIFLPFAK